MKGVKVRHGLKQSTTEGLCPYNKERHLPLCVIMHQQFFPFLWFWMVHATAVDIPDACVRRMPTNLPQNVDDARSTFVPRICVSGIQRLLPQNLTCWNNSLRVGTATFAILYRTVTSGASHDVSTFSSDDEYRRKKNMNFPSLHATQLLVLRAQSKNFQR